MKMLTAKKKLKKALKELFFYDVFDYQLDFVYDCLTKTRVVGVFSRQSGKSLCLSFVAVLEALRNPRQNIIIVAPSDKQAGELFEKIAMNLELSVLKSEVTSITKRTALFVNGARITAHTVGDRGEKIRGLTGAVNIMEEAAFIKDSIVSSVIMPFGATKIISQNGESREAKFIKISTPFGKNHFYDSAMGRYADQWTLHHYDWKYPVNAGLMMQSFIDKERESITDLEFRTEYGAEFIADEDAYFPSTLIESCIEEYPMIEVPV